MEGETLRSGISNQINSIYIFFVYKLVNIDGLMSVNMDILQWNILR